LVQRIHREADKDNYYTFWLPDNTTATYVVNNTLFALTPDEIYCFRNTDDYHPTPKPIDFEIKKIINADYDLTETYSSDNSSYTYTEFFIIDGDNNLRRYNLETNTLGDVLSPNISDFYCVPNYSEDKWKYVALTTNGELYLQGLVETRKELQDPNAPYSTLNQYEQDYYVYNEPIKLFEDVKSVNSNRGRTTFLTNSGEVYDCNYYDPDTLAMELEKISMSDSLKVNEFYFVVWQNDILFKSEENEYFSWNHRYNRQKYVVLKNYSNFTAIASIGRGETSLAIDKKGYVYYWGSDPLRRTLYSFWVIPSKGYQSAGDNNPEKLPKLKGIDKILAGHDVFYAFDGNTVYVV
jgi:hypothetical protein